MRSLFLLDAPRPPPRRQAKAKACSESLYSQQMQMLSLLMADWKKIWIPELYQELDGVWHARPVSARLWHRRRATPTRPVAKLPASLWDGSPIMGPGSGTSETQRRQEYERQTDKIAQWCSLWYVGVDHNRNPNSNNWDHLVGNWLNQWWHGTSGLDLKSTSLWVINILQLSYCYSGALLKRKVDNRFHMWSQWIMIVLLQNGTKI